MQKESKRSQQFIMDLKPQVLILSANPQEDPFEKNSPPKRFRLSPVQALTGVKTQFLKGKFGKSSTQRSAKR